MLALAAGRGDRAQWAVVLTRVVGVALVETPARVPDLVCELVFGAGCELVLVCVLGELGG